VTATEAALRVLVEPGSTVELRVPKAGRARVVSGYFDDPAAMAHAAARLDGRHPGIYVTANPVNPALLARASNRVVEHAELTTGDHDVARRRWLPIDLDPVRPAGVSATDTEHAAAIAKAREIATYLTGEGWPAPVLADSGNGTYVLARVDLPNDEASRELLHRCLEALAFRFDDEAVHVDGTMFNAARIIRVPGTRNAKGDSTSDRPHRTARLLEVPDPLEVTSAEQLRALAAILPEPEPSGQTGGRRGEQAAAFDLEAFIAKHLQVHHESPWGQGGHRWVLTACPFNSDHAELSAYVARRPSGAIVAGCQHYSCTWSWRDLRERLDPKPAKPARRKGKRETAAPPAPAKDEPLPEVTREAGAEILDEIEQRYRAYVAWASDHQAVAVTLWTAHTHAAGASDTTPYLAIESAEPESGKTRTLEVAEHLAARAWMLVEPSEAAMFRKIERDHPTILLDESDALWGAKADGREGLRALLNAGYRRGATVPRCVGEGNGITVQDFPVYGPKALAGLAGRLPRTIASRSIPIRLQRRAKGETVARFRARRAAAELGPLRLRLAAWVALVAPELEAADPEIPEALSDRQADCWEALFAVADAASDVWGKRARAAAVELHGHDPAADPSTGVLLLTHAREAFTVRDDKENVTGHHKELATASLLWALIRRDDGPWATWWGKDVEDGKTTAPASRLAHLLKPYGVEPKQLKIKGEKVRGYERAAFADAWKRYLDPGTDSADGTQVLRRSEAISDAEPGSVNLAPEQGRTAVPAETRYPGRAPVSACAARHATPEPSSTGAPPTAAAGSTRDTSHAAPHGSRSHDPRCPADRLRRLRPAHRQARHPLPARRPPGGLRPLLQRRR
jgi:hypothetical protein